MILAIIHEKQFQGLIEEAVRRESKDCLVLTDEETMMAALQEGTPNVLFLEIGVLALDAVELIQKLKRSPSTQRVPIVAFGNSLRTDLLQDAKEAGADLALPTAAFRNQLPELIRHYDKCHK